MEERQQTGTFTEEELEELIEIIRTGWQEGDPKVCEFVNELRGVTRDSKGRVRRGLTRAWGVIEEFTVKLTAEYFKRMSG